MTDIQRIIRAVTYVSFAENKCLGVCVLPGELDVIQAAKTAWALGINPGGQVMAISCKETDPDVPLNIFEAMWANMNTLLTVQQAKDLFEAKSLRELEEEK